MKILSNELECDNEGVPLLVQKLEYYYGERYFTATFFNGGKKIFTAEIVCPSLGIVQHEPSQMQWLEAENNICKIALGKWRDMYPTIGSNLETTGMSDRIKIRRQDLAITHALTKFLIIEPLRPGSLITIYDELGEELTRGDVLEGDTYYKYPLPKKQKVWQINVLIEHIDYDLVTLRIKTHAEEDTVVNIQQNKRKGSVHYEI